MSKFKNKKNKSTRVFTNHSIRAYQVRCINQDGDNLGVISRDEAIKLAENAGLDLVQISYAKRGETPTCKILDYGKYKYDLSKKEKEQNRKQRESAVKLKEITFRPTTDDNDLSIKAKQAKKFLEDGHQVKLSVRFKKRELRHTKIGYEQMSKIFDMLNTEVGVKYLSAPNMSGKLISAIVASDLSAQKRGVA